MTGSAATPNYSATLQRLLFVAACALLLADAWLVLDRAAGAFPADFDLDRRLIGDCGALLLCVGWKGRLGRRRAFVLGGLVGALFFFRIFGFALLDPTQVQWLLRDDWAQHYSGWEMFRASPWTWPPGLMPRVAYPVGTAIVFTDSLPLLAYLFKPFSALLPAAFQYIGLWFFLNAVLLGGFGALLVQRWSDHAASLVAAAALFVYAPVFVQRMGHDALSAHWMLLAAIWLTLRDIGKEPIAAPYWAWWILLALASLTHPYLAVMCLAIHGAFLLRRYGVEQRFSPWPVAAFALIAGAIVLTGWWSTGAFSLPFGGGSAGIAYGIYSLNLLAFVNAMGYSRLLPQLPIGQGQYEGFAYLGLGMLGLAAMLALQFAAVRRSRGALSRSEWPLWILAVLFTLFAVSTVVMIGPRKLVDWPIESGIVATFRGSGRFVWLAYYGLIFVLLRRALSAFAPLCASALLVATLGVQVWDLSWISSHFARLRTAQAGTATTTTLHDPRWHSLAQGRSHLTVLPPIFCGEQPGSYLPYLLLAAREGMSLNTGYLARWNAEAEGQYCEALMARIDRGERGADELYVVSPAFRARFDAPGTPMRCETLDGRLACVKK